MAGKPVLFTEEDLRVLRRLVRAERSGRRTGARRRRRPRLHGLPPGFWARLKTEVGSGEYTARRLKSDAETDADTEADDLTGVWEVNGLEGLPVGAVDVGAVVWVERDWSADEEEWRFAYELQAGTADVPAVILPAAFENETAQTDDWDRDAPPGGKDGVEVRVQMRTAYCDAGDETLYAFYRTFTYDSQGNLVTISAETRVSIDVPEACP
ncbi:unnamed protein product [marine sediment metagenome]|uniref:Uncharacterized protein n=1 Tax=marine sediment metagenome TaxID=412755 RepID=X1HKK3_9ZZZZ